MAVETPAVNMDKLMAFLGQVIGELGATVNAGLIVIGDRLGLYKAMAGAGPITSTELAEKTRTSERYVREWLNAQAAGGFVTYDPITQRYELPPEQAMALADEDSPAFVGGAFELATATLLATPHIQEVFQSGAGFGWHEHDLGVSTGCERFFRPGYNANLVSAWLPGRLRAQPGRPRVLRVLDLPVHAELARSGGRAGTGCAGGHQADPRRRHCRRLHPLPQGRGDAVQQRLRSEAIACRAGGCKT